MKTLENIGAFIVKNWRWVLMILCILIFLIFPDTFIAGMAVVGFVWSVYGIWSNHQKNLKT